MVDKDNHIIPHHSGENSNKIEVYIGPFFVFCLFNVKKVDDASDLGKGKSSIIKV